MRKKGPAAHGRIGKRKIGLLSAVLLAAVMIVTAVQLSGADPLKLEEGCCSLTVNLCGPESEFAGDLASAGATVNLYQVALAEKTDGVDAYHYILTDAFKGDEKLAEKLAEKNLPELEAKDWESLAEAAAQIVAEGTVSPDARPAAGDKAEGLDAGLYLLLVEGGPVDTARYSYTFAPELVSLPGKPEDAGGNVNTANPGDWLYAVEVSLKPSRKERLGSLEITKTLNLTGPMPEPVMFTFRVTAVLDGETVYDDIVGIRFAGAGDQKVLIDDIPVGATVTVTEIYDGGPGYTVTSSDTQSGEITADGVLGMTFVNEGSGRGGDGIVNSFEFGEDGGWSWTPNPPQSGSE